MVQLLCTLLNLYLIVLVGRIILSWFPIQPGSFLAQVFAACYAVTEPILGPIRRAIPPTGMIDLSVLVLIVGIRVVSIVVLGC